MEHVKHPIGIFDSGVGGLTVLREIHRLIPGESLVYLGDTARVPYGTKSAETVQRYAGECTRYLLSRSVKMIIVACNTASALALDTVKKLSPVPVIGMIEPAVAAALRRSRSGKIGVIGTSGTIHSGAYQAALRVLSRDAVTVHAHACPLFVPLAEEGWHHHQATRLIAAEYLHPLREAGVDALILGCTHFPMLADIIRQYLPEVALINSGREAAQQARQLVGANGVDTGRNTTPIDCAVTDKPLAFAEIAERFLGQPLPAVRTVTLDEIRYAEAP